MLRLAIVLLVLALVAAALGLGEIAGWAWWAAGALFVIGLILLVIGLITGRTPSV